MKLRMWGIRAIVVLYLTVQVSLPLLGLAGRDDDVETVPFSWHMFSRVGDDEGP